MRRRELMLVLGAAMAAARALRAQQKAMAMVGFLGGESLDALAANVAAFRRGLSEAGYVEGQNVTIEYRWAEGRYDRLPSLAINLVAHKPDVIVTYDASAINAAKSATSTIPIIFFGGGDPVASGLVASLARPGGNLTGVSIMAPELNPKRLDLIFELVPQAGVIALLVNPNNSSAERTIQDLQEAANAKGVHLAILKAGVDGHFAPAFASLVQLHAGAVVVGSDAFFFSRREQLVALAAEHAVPAIYDAREFVAIGGLVSYGSSFTNSWPQVGIYAGKILKGANPADLPVQQPTKFELVINLKTARALGLTIPPVILARADEIIE
jgi:putative ABC transport system substrate-binding protein